MDQSETRAFYRMAAEQARKEEDGDQNDNNQVFSEESKEIQEIIEDADAEVTEFKETKKKRKKNPDLPKRAPSGYLQFCAEERPRMKKEVLGLLGVAVPAMSRELGRRLVSRRKIPGRIEKTLHNKGRESQKTHK